MVKKTVVELDLVGYSDVSRTLEENLGVELVASFNAQIQGFVNRGLAEVNIEPHDAVRAKTGDGAIVIFDQPEDAFRFAVAVHEASRAHNAGRSIASAQRWFRIGIATGDLHEEQAGGVPEIAGTVIANAVRFEAAARPGQIILDNATFTALDAALLQGHAGPEEMIAGKRQEMFAVRRVTVIPYEVQDDQPATAITVLELLDRLNPRNQLDRLFILLRMPVANRPPNTLTLFERTNNFLDWLDQGGGGGMPKAAEVLREMIKKQEPPPPRR